jgi:hypothetical protein
LRRSTHLRSLGGRFIPQYDQFALVAPAKKHWRDIRQGIPLQDKKVPNVVLRQNVVRAKNRTILRRVQLKMKRESNQESSPTQRFSFSATCGRIQRTHIFIKDREGAVSELDT